MNDVEKLLTITFPELESSANVFSTSMLNLLTRFPSANAINGADVKEIEAFFNRKGRAPKMGAKDVKALAKESIGTATKATEKVLSMTIKEIVFINKEIEEIEELMKEFVEQQDEEESFSVKEYIDILKSIPGISDVTAMQFISEVGDIKRFKNVRKLVAYAGVDPSVYQSGKYEGRGRISKRGNRHLRRVLWIMATSVVLHNKQIREYFDKVRERQPYKKAIMKVIHKLLRIIFAMLSHKRAYLSHPEYLLSTNFS